MKHQLLYIALRRTGVQHSVHIANGGADGIRYLKGEAPFSDRAKFPLPKVVFVDLRMRDISGFDVLRWLKDESSARSYP